MSTTELATGIHSMSEEDYQADKVADRPSLSASICKILIASTPLHAWTAHPKLNPNFVREEKELFDRGTVAHALLLQGLRNAHIIRATNKDGEVVSNWQTKAAKQERDEARAAGKVPILEYQWHAVEAMVERAREQLAAHKEAKNAFTNGKPEVTITWIDHATDGTEVLCRARLDWLHDDHRFIDDYKSSGRDVNPETIASKMLDDWDIQAEFYRRGLEKITGIRPQFRFCAQENTEPYALSVIGIDPAFEWIGQKKVQAAIDTWAKCLAANDWPGYPDRICFPVLPEWAEKSWLRKEMEQ